jgi:hypothetical protein
VSGGIRVFRGIRGDPVRVVVVKPADELKANWKMAMNGEEPCRIQPLQWEGSEYVPWRQERGGNRRVQIDYRLRQWRAPNLRRLATAARWTFCELASREAFKTVRVAFDSIEWDNGLDLDPEYLYEHSETIPCEQAAAVDPALCGAADLQRWAPGA